MTTRVLQLLSASLIVLGFTTGGCQTPTASGPVEASPQVIKSVKRYRREYLIAAGDVFDVKVRGHADLTLTCTVRPDGFVTVPILDEVKAEGLTAAELDAELTTRLAKRIKDPEVAVILTTMRPPMVYLLGEVPNPQAVPFRNVSNALHAITAAGGFKPTAAKDAVIVIRLGEDNYLYATKIDLSVRGQPAAYLALHNLALLPEDVVFVPKTGIAQINEWINEYINQPLQGISSVTSTYVNARLIELIQGGL